MRAKDFTDKHNQEADYGPDFQAMVSRVGKLAKEGPRKTVWDPKKRVYKTVPIEPKKQTDLEEYTDPELARTLAYAGVHYPNFKKRPEAFMKWASRAIMHSEEQDTKHNSQFADIHHELDQIKQILAKISNR